MSFYLAFFNKPNIINVSINIHTNAQKVLNGKEPQTIQGFKMKMPPPTQTKKQTLHSKFLTCKWVRPTIMK